MFSGLQDSTNRKISYFLISKRWAFFPVLSSSLAIGTIENGGLAVHQYLLRDIDEEQSALTATLDHLSGDRPALVTFNGKSFDVPYLSDRLAYYGMSPLEGIPHFDVLHFSRRRWKDHLPSLRLTCA